MGRHKMNDSEKAEHKRKIASKYYNGHKINYRISYLVKTYNIKKEELDAFETDEEKLKYCIKVKIERQIEKVLEKISNI